MSRYYKNPKWTKRHYECTNVVACEAPDNVTVEKWVPCEASYLDGLEHLWTEKGVRYYGYL